VTIFKIRLKSLSVNIVSILKNEKVKNRFYHLPEINYSKNTTKLSCILFYNYIAAIEYFILKVKIFREKVVSICGLAEIIALFHPFLFIALLVV